MTKWLQVVALLLRVSGAWDAIKAYLSRRSAMQQQKLTDQAATDQEVLKTVETQHEVQAGVLATDDELKWLLSVRLKK